MERHAEMEPYEDAALADGFVFYTGPGPAYQDITQGFDPSQPQTGTPPSIRDINPEFVPPEVRDFVARFLEAIEDDPNQQENIDRLMNQDEITYLDRLEIAGDFATSLNEGYYDDLIIEAANSPVFNPTVRPPPIVELLPPEEAWWQPEEDLWDTGGSWGSGGFGGGATDWDFFYAEHAAIF